MLFEERVWPGVCRSSFAVCCALSWALFVGIGLVAVCRCLLIRVCRVLVVV